MISRVDTRGSVTSIHEAVLKITEQSESRRHKSLALQHGSTLDSSLILSPERPYTNLFQRTRYSRTEDTSPRSTSSKSSFLEKTSAYTSGRSSLASSTTMPQRSSEITSARPSNLARGQFTADEESQRELHTGNPGRTIMSATSFDESFLKRQNAIRRGRPKPFSGLFRTVLKSLKALKRKSSRPVSVSSPLPLTDTAEEFELQSSDIEISSRRIAELHTPAFLQLDIDINAFKIFNTLALQLIHMDSDTLKSTQQSLSNFCVQWMDDRMFDLPISEYVSVGYRVKNLEDEVSRRVMELTSFSNAWLTISDSKKKSDELINEAVKGIIDLFGGHEDTNLAMRDMIETLPSVASPPILGEFQYEPQVLNEYESLTNISH